MKNNFSTPPKYAQKFLNWVLKPELAEEVLGDLEEKFYQKLNQKTPFKAKANYWYQTINYLRPFAMKNSIITDLNPFFMFNSYFKIAWRGLFKQKLYSLINISGMTIGMTCFILLSLYIQYELSYDLQHENAAQIYRVAQAQEGNTFKGTNQFAASPMLLAPAMQEQIPEVEAATTLTTLTSLFKKAEQPLYELGLYADAALFDVFTYPVIEGDAKAALKDKDAIILTETMAKKYFGNQSPIGQMIEQQNNRMVIVKAVIEDIPRNQHLRFQFIKSIENYEEYVLDRDRSRWSSNNYWTYATLKKGTDIQKIEQAISPFAEKATAELAKFNLPFKISYFLQPLVDIHLHSNINADVGGNGDIRYIYLSASIAFIILLLALINYMNLATARTAQRGKEVGVRKVLGAVRKQLVNQFMLESALLTGISLVAAILIARQFMPFFNQLLDLEIPFEIVGNPMLILGLLGVALLLGICSGFYPAMLFSAISPIKSLKGNWLSKGKGGGAFMRNIMVVGQFTAAIVLAISSVVIYQQLQFIQNKKLGYDREQLAYVTYRLPNLFQKTGTIKNELQKHPNIEQVTITNTLPLNSTNQGLAMEWEGKTANDGQLPIYRIQSDYNFLDAFGMELVAGRNFSPDFPTDSTEAFILNETAIKSLGWQDPIGKSFRNGKVIGVVKDFHFQPFNFSIKPMQITFHKEGNIANFGVITMKMKMEENMEPTVAYAEKTLKTLLPEITFNLNYMDDAYNNLYQNEQRFGSTFSIFTMLALFIACIGLFGLVTHNVIQRTKEIGIRKVLGASVVNIVELISKDFLRLVLFSTLLAIPLAWWGMNTWLQDFAYRIEINWGVFIVVGLVAILIAFLTIGSQSLKAALSNPVDAIKSE